MSGTRAGLVGGLAALISLLPVTAAQAAAPPNDVASRAVQINTLPFSIEQDTTEATTDAGDALLNQNCGAPATDASVWYSYTPAADGVVSVSTGASDYSGGALVATGQPDALSLIACGQFGTSFFATAGVTYSIMAIDDQLDGDGRNGGTLRLQVDEQLIRPVDLSLTVDPVGIVDKAGVATVTGTVSCTGGDFAELFTTLSQSVGRVATIRGIGSVSAACEGTSPWSARVAPDSGKFAGGKSASLSFVFSCNIFVCNSYQQEAVVQLRKGGR